MKKILIVVGVVYGLSVSAQNLKTYSGDYKLSGYDHNNLSYSIEGGKASFTYSEDPVTKEYIKQGLFKYQLSLTGWTETITGYYKAGLKQGRWTHTIKKVDYPDESVPGRYQTLTVILNANYNKGYPDSTWALSYSEKYREKVWVNFQEVWGKYSPEYIIKSNTTFINGMLVGNSNTVVTEGSVKIVENKVSMNKNGFVIGEARFLNRDEEEVYSFMDNKLVKVVIRNPQTGQIKNSEDFTALIECVNKEIMDEWLPPCLRDTSTLSILDGKMISDELFHFTGLGGDNTLLYDMDEAQLFNNISGAYFIRYYRAKSLPKKAQDIKGELVHIADSINRMFSTVKGYGKTFYYNVDPMFKNTIGADDKKYVPILERTSLADVIYQNKYYTDAYLVFVERLCGRITEPLNESFAEFTQRNRPYSNQVKINDEEFNKIKSGNEVKTFEALRLSFMTKLTESQEAYNKLEAIKSKQ